ncbi:MAG: acyl carrier protein [Coriobacteriia bacterium]|nr:acyl carrier protein [Coriobacteriia bacterium]
MERSEVLKTITSVVADQLGVEASEVKESSSFIEDFGADSLDLVELVMAFEDEFGVTIPDEDVENIKTVSDAADFITAHA